MSGSTQDPTAAGYQEDGSTSQQDNSLSQDGQGNDEGQPKGDDKTEQQVADGGEQKGDDQGGNPLTALVQNRQQTRASTDQYQSQIAALQQEVATLKAGGQTDTKPKAWANPFDVTEAPVDHFRAEVEHLRAEVGQLRQDGEQEIGQARNVRALADFEQEVSTELSIAGQETPEVLAAYGFVNSQVTNMLKGQGLRGKPLAQATRNNILQAFVNGHTNGLSHTETVAQMALNMGFSPTKAAKAEKAEPVKRGQKAANQSLGHAAGAGGADTPPSAKEVAGMSTEQVRKLPGGTDYIRSILKGERPIE